MKTKKNAPTKRVSRRAFIGASVGALASMGLSGCSQQEEPPKLNDDTPATPLPKRLPDASPNSENPFGVDMNVNTDTIDEYLGLEGVSYREMRMLEDPADFAALDGNSDLDITIEGFRITPLPYLATLPTLPVEGAYMGDRLFDVVWSDDEQVISVTPRYEEAEQIIEELFPRESDLVLMCGGGGYAGMMRKLLLFLGWDGKRIYNIGGGWNYTGYHAVQLISYADDGAKTYHLWRADQAAINFDQLTPIA